MEAEYVRWNGMSVVVLLSHFFGDQTGIPQSVQVGSPVVAVDLSVTASRPRTPNGCHSPSLEDDSVSITSALSRRKVQRLVYVGNKVHE